MDIVKQILDDLDDDFLDDFGQKTNEIMDDIERYLMDIHHMPTESLQTAYILELIQELKINCRIAFLDPLLGNSQ